MRREGGDQGQGLLELLNESRPAIEKLFGSYRVPLADAEDLVQEAVMVMLQRWERIKQPQHYLMGTLWRLIQRHRRRRQREGWVQLDEEKLEAVAVASSGAAAVESREEVRRLLAMLPARAGRIVELRYGHELTVKEMAAVLHIAESGVRKIAGRQLRRLRRAAKEAGLIE
ncbi:MAG TPA: sigma-70 family RNA polymerase sigma factor [Thermoanaerobaculia bacterium]|nr:sigma-70 family RNA polymerase sigma factor [Thermoanaerobaculia bacterium]